MRVDCEKRYLQKAVSLVERSTGKKLALPVLGKVLLEVKNKNLFIKGTNLEIAVEVGIPSKGGQDGVVAVSGLTLEAHLAGLPETNISLETTNESLILKTPNSSALIVTETTDDFPLFSRDKKNNNNPIFIVGAPDLVYALRSVVYASSPSDIKPELSSVSIVFSEDELIFAATDTFRLAEKIIKYSGADKNKTAGSLALIPHKNALEIVRIFENQDGLVDMFYSPDEIILKNDSIFVTTRLLGGTFPSYQNIIPKSTSTQTIVSRDDLISAVKLATVFSDKFNQISLRIIPEDHLFEVGGRAKDRGEGTARVEATTEGLPIDIRLNAKYLIDCLNVLKSGDITLGFNGGERAAVIRHSGDRSFFYLIMPLNK